MAELELTLNPEIEKSFIQDLDLEIEYLNGTREIQKNGQVKLTMEVSEEKGEIMKRLVLSMIAKTNEINLN